MQPITERRSTYFSDDRELLPSHEAIETEYKNRDAWGLLTSIDLHQSDPHIIRDADEIKRFVIELCDRIGMKRFGECTVVNFGEDDRVAGFSMTQLIETSLISGHFANATNTVYLDIFSCKCYDPGETAEFARRFFKANEYQLSIMFRR